jgi:2-polyprenyl-6-methoxyphenol hydroxylase-like FAD-dependent oxidoreductase
MKQSIAIIGGGVAALAFAICYKKLGHRVDIYERHPLSGREGLGFIMLENGVKALTNLGLYQQATQAGYPLTHCQIRDKTNKNLLNKEIPGSFATTRKAFIDILLGQIPPEWLHFGYHFSHFEWHKSGQANYAVFDNGEKIAADLFLGCDGAKSQVREQIFPNAPVSKIKVQELVSVVEDSTLVQALNHHFIKYKNKSGGLAAGLVPANNNKVVWFIQYDIQKYHITADTAQSKREFALQTLKDWPQYIQRLLAHTDFTNSHIWKTRYLYPLSRFHYNNVVLLGDAAHALLPFTSQGVNSAMEDAIKLAKQLNNNQVEHLPMVLQQYSAVRKYRVEQYLMQGIKLQDEFLAKHHQQQKIPFAF